MLSRVADSLYWMSRYLERSEHLARLIEVNLNLMLDHSATPAERRWRHVLECMGHSPSADVPLDTHRVVQTWCADPANRSSIVSCITSARENARQVREQISSEMWEQLNRLFHEVRRAGLEESWESEPMAFLAAVQEGSWLFQGITNAMMNHGEGWHFIRLGRYIERALNLTTLLDVHFAAIAPGAADAHIEWLGLLKSASAFEAYCKVHTADLKPERIAEFLLLNAEFPHSIRFAIDALQNSLHAISEHAPPRKSAHLERLAGRLRAALSYSPIEEIMFGGLHSYLENIRRQCAQIHTALFEVYITYAIESALEA